MAGFRGAAAGLGGVEGLPTQDFRVEPKAASRLARATSGDKEDSAADRPESLYFPPRRRLRHEVEDGSVMRPS